MPRTRHQSPRITAAALAGRTPREAVVTASGRRKVDALLREMEHHTSSSDMAGLYDFSQLRRTLRL